MTMNIQKYFLSLIIMGSLGVFQSAAVMAADELGCLSGDCINGKGVLKEIGEKGKTTYRGDFKDGKYHGSGRLSYDDEATVYKGYWVSGKKQGRGILWDKDNNVFIGQWRNDRRNGQGVQAMAVPDWKEDKHSEFWLMENTENYTGNFQNDVFFGQGTYRWTDGTKYVGAWVANKKHGAGYFDYGLGKISNHRYEYDQRVFGF